MGVGASSKRSPNVATSLGRNARLQSKFDTMPLSRRAILFLALTAALEACAHLSSSRLEIRQRVPVPTNQVVAESLQDAARVEVVLDAEDASFDLRPYVSMENLDSTLAPPRRSVAGRIGQRVISPVPAGSYRVRVALLGYEPASAVIQVRPREHLILRARLRRFRGRIEEIISP